MLQNFRQQLTILKKRSSEFENSSASPSEKSEMRRSCIDIFEALIYFWRDCIHYFRRYPPSESSFSKMIFFTHHTCLCLVRFDPQKTDEWKEVEASFKDTRSKIGDALDHLEKYFTVTTISQPASISSAGNVLPLVIVPERQASTFVGRDDILRRMETQLTRDITEANSLAVFCLCGIGGVGKTEIALQYAQAFTQRHKGNFDAVLWFRAETQLSLSNAFTKVAIELDLEGASVTGNAEHNKDLVHHWLRVTGRHWLLIFDNVDSYDTVADFIPWRTRGALIVTTRLPNVAQAFKSSDRQYEVVSGLDKTQATELFLRLLFKDQNSAHRITTTLDDLPEDDQVAVRFLLTEMGGLALGIRQLAAYIDQRNLKNNIAKFASQYKRFFPRIINGPSGFQGHTLRTLWEMSFRDIWAHHEDPQYKNQELYLFLPSDKSIASERLHFCQEEFDVDDASDILVNMGLIERHGDVLAVHRLVQVAYLFWIDDAERQSLFRSASALCNHQFPKQIKGRQLYEQWADCQKWIQHGVRLSALFSRLGDVQMTLHYTRDFVELSENCAWYLYEAGNRSGTIALIDSGLSACGTQDDLGRAHLLNTKSQTYFALNDLAQCRAALADSRLIRETALDPNDEELANTYLNFGNLEAAEGRYDEAIKMFEKSISIRQHLPGAQGMIAVCHLTTARALLNKRDYDAAAEKMDQSQQIFEVCFGCKAYNHLFVHYARGNLYLAKGDIEKARASFQATFELQVEHAAHMLKVAAIYFKLGTCDYHLKSYTQAM
ncbi:hypothetical protein IL306_012885 [Fusarium sp. DS 682]|nr:hypothetical protein IL306_012885 [Fusarium sp. DS 682]